MANLKLLFTDFSQRKGWYWPLSQGQVNDDAKNMPQGSRPLPLPQQTWHDHQGTILFWRGPYSGSHHTYHMHPRENIINWHEPSKCLKNTCTLKWILNQNNLKSCQCNETLQIFATVRIHPRLRGTLNLQISLPCIPCAPGVRWAGVSVMTTPLSIFPLTIPPSSPHADPKG